MELLFGDELLDMLTLHFLDALLQLDLEPLAFSTTCCIDFQYYTVFSFQSQMTGSEVPFTFKSC